MSNGFKEFTDLNLALHIKHDQLLPLGALPKYLWTVN